MEILLKYFSDFTEPQINQLSLLKDLYAEWNDKINVVSRKDIENLYLHHVLHSLSIATICEFEAGTKIIDIGTGGGFPGIPLAIFFPDVNFHLVDSIGKKLKVVEVLAQMLELQNVTTQHCRAEEIKNSKFDFAITRAVAPLKELCKWAKPLILKKSKNKIANGLITLKGGDLANEISESNVRPRIMPIQDLFAEDYFKEKYILYTPL